MSAICQNPVGQSIKYGEYGSGDIRETYDIPTSTTVTYTVSGGVRLDQPETVSAFAAVAVTSQQIDIRPSNNQSADVNRVRAVDVTFSVDGAVNLEDFRTFASDFGKTIANSRSDLNGDGRVDFGDFLIFSANFGAG